MRLMDNSIHLNLNLNGHTWLVLILLDSRVKSRALSGNVTNARKVKLKDKAIKVKAYFALLNIHKKVSWICVELLIATLVVCQQVVFNCYQWYVLYSNYLFSSIQSLSRV